MFKQSRYIILLLLTAVTVVGGYFFLRYAYRVTDQTPFTQEIVVIVLGTVATILITALLLNKQTAVEVKKEQNIRFLDLKVQTYENLITKIEQLSILRKVNQDDFVQLQFITHRLAIVASPPVLEEYFRFLEAIKEVAVDGSISMSDSIKLSQRMAQLTVEIRQDLIGDADEISVYEHHKIKQQILDNSSESMDLSLAEQQYESNP